jgi:elongation factor 1-gamma
LDEDEDKKEKKKNVLDSLPPSKFVMDDWKRFYSNNDSAKSMAYLWENYDPTGYSIWFAEYKYNNELEKIFMTLNLLGGFIQRLDKLRKYGFGSLCIFGANEPPFEIGCCWLFRGTEIPAEMKECDDAEHYNWKKADTNDSATRQLINDYFTWEGSFGGKKFNQGKIFK